MCRRRAATERAVAQDKGLAVRVEVIERDNRDEIERLERAHERELAARDKQLQQLQAEVLDVRSRLTNVIDRNAQLTAQYDQARRGVLEARAQTRRYFLDAQRLAKTVEKLQGTPRPEPMLMPPRTAPRGPQKPAGGNPSVFGF